MFEGYQHFSSLFQGNDILYMQDLRMDNPDAEHLLSLFLGRVIVDEVLPPKFLTAVLPSLENKSLGVDIVQATGKMP